MNGLRQHTYTTVIPKKVRKRLKKIPIHAKKILTNRNAAAGRSSSPNNAINPPDTIYDSASSSMPPPKIIVLKPICDNDRARSKATQRRRDILGLKTSLSLL